MICMSDVGLFADFSILVREGRDFAVSTLHHLLKASRRYFPTSFQPLIASQHYFLTSFQPLIDLIQTISCDILIY